MTSSRIPFAIVIVVIVLAAGCVSQPTVSPVPSGELPTIATSPAMPLSPIVTAAPTAMPAISPVTQVPEKPAAVIPTASGTPRGISPEVTITGKPVADAVNASNQTGLITTTGTVVFNDFEGGFYGIVADDNKHYLPLHIDDEYKVNGTRIAFEGALKQNVYSIYNWGYIIEITSIKRI